MPGQYSTITLVGPHLTRDLALPHNVPVAQLLPQILKPGVLRGEAEEAEPASWMLTTVDGRRLPGEATLRELDLCDGEILHLHDATDAVITAPVEDVRDAIEDISDDYGRTWQVGTGRVFATGTATAVVAATALIGGGQIAVLVTGGLICILAVLVAWWAARYNSMLTHLALAVGAMWGWRFGYQVSETLVPEGIAAEPMRHVYGLVIALVVTVICLIGTPLGLPYVTALSLLALLGAAGAGALAAGASVVQVACGEFIAAVFLLGVLPRATMSTGSLFGLDSEIQAGRDMTAEALRTRIERIDAMLCGGLIALALVIGGASIALTLDGDGYAALLGLGVAATLLTRSRIFDLIRHVAPLRVVAALTLAFAGWYWMQSSPLLAPWIPAIAVLLCLAYAGLAMVDLSTVAKAQTRRIVGIAEIVLVAVLLALVGQVIGLYDLIATISR